MDIKTYEKITSYIRDICGLNLGADKEYLVNQRLLPVIEKLGLTGFDELAQRMNSKFDSHLREQVIVAITTNETSFFRDIHPYQMLDEKIVPILIQLIRERKQRSFIRRGSKVSIWSAACSTGQEPYSMAIKIRDHLTNHFITDVEPQDFSILATDISSKVLAKAIRGSYTESDLKRGLTQMDIARHFVKDGSEWMASDELRKLIDFKSINLTESFVHIGGFDLIFCRNVLIYFEDSMKQKILTQMCEMLTTGGILVLGAAESMYGISGKFVQMDYKGSHFFQKQ